MAKADDSTSVTHTTRAPKIDTGMVLNELFNINAMALAAASLTFEDDGENSDKAHRVMRLVSERTINLLKRIDEASVSAAQKGGAA